MRRGRHWRFYENFKRKYPRTYALLNTQILSEVGRCVSNGQTYILAQGVASKLRTVDYQFETSVPDYSLHSLAGMDLYNIMESLPGWYFNKTELSERNFLQTIYFKGEKRDENDQ
ncbi:hypothetical protein V6C32_11455 [Desulforamulus ruminis]|uniref:hypothetical protein n=1 Tax=Desulforamulus ruminis TaxID=1564 RepID=UPI002FD92952